MDLAAGSCHACHDSTGPVIKYSLGKDLFGRPYDRLSPSADQSPKWYCETCSMHKTLQRDFRDIRTEYDKLTVSQPSELSKGEEFRRAFLRLREILTILNAQPGRSPFLSESEVLLLMERLNTATMPA
ncbi:hypothetical protein ACO9S2_16695 [Nitrospira sp. NS4]|uniref:hypothetical protein n=1 Tax=Nitrospira sp. NS4 TaxID=3414498 RepID=UPI003C2EC494